MGWRVACIKATESRSVRGQVKHGRRRKDSRKRSVLEGSDQRAFAPGREVTRSRQIGEWCEGGERRGSVEGAGGRGKIKCTLVAVMTQETVQGGEMNQHRPRTR